MYHYETSNRDGAEREEEGGERERGYFWGFLGRWRILGMQMTLAQVVERDTAAFNGTRSNNKMRIIGRCSR